MAGRLGRVTLADGDLADLLQAWLPAQRWFTGRDDPVRQCAVVSRIDLGGGAEHVVMRVELHAGEPQMYQVPVLVREHPDTASIIGSTDAGFLHDGLRHEHVVRALLAQPDGADVDPGCDSLPLQTAWTAGRPEGRFRVLDADQSNTSVVVGDTLVKFYRRLQPGMNPDVEIHAGLARVDPPVIDPLRGWLNGNWSGDRLSPGSHLALATTFFPNAAPAAVIAEDAAREQESFTLQARAIGTLTAQLHVQLAGVFGVESADPATAAVRARMHVDRAAALLPVVKPLVADLHRRIDAATPSGRIEAQRIHGDLHLGQVLRTEDQWRIVDFEGEPGTATEARRAPDSPLRDIAGVLRSFDYVGEFAASDTTWVSAAQDAFITGYVESGGIDPREHSGLLTIYLIDKAAYEAVYEAGHRPELVSIPLAALLSLAGS